MNKMKGPYSDSLCGFIGRILLFFRDSKQKISNSIIVGMGLKVDGLFPLGLHIFTFRLSDGLSIQCCVLLPPYMQILNPSYMPVRASVCYSIIMVLCASRVIKGLVTNKCVSYLVNIILNRVYGVGQIASL